MKDSFALLAVVTRRAYGSLVSIFSSCPFVHISLFFCYRQRAARRCYERYHWSTFITFFSCISLTGKMRKANVDQTKFHGSQTLQFTRDDVARITAFVLAKLLDELRVTDSVEGIPIQPAGASVFLVD